MRWSTYLGICLFLGLASCADAPGNTDGMPSGAAPDSTVSDNERQSDASNLPTPDVGVRSQEPDQGSFGTADGSLGGPPPSNGVDAGELGGSADSGLDGNGGGGGRGGGECAQGIGGLAILTNGDGQAAEVIDVILQASEDSPGYFALGVRLELWSPELTVSLTVLDAGTPVAEGTYDDRIAACDEDGLWFIPDLRLNALPSIEIDDIIELELDVTGEVRSGSAEDPAIAIEGTIRLQY